MKKRGEDTIGRKRESCFLMWFGGCVLHPLYFHFDSSGPDTKKPRLKRGFNE